MSDRTFEQLWRKLLIYSPECPIPLAQEFVNTAYSRALGSYEWAGLRRAGEFQIPAPYTTGTATVTLNSATVTGSGTTWTSAMAGRQFFLAGREYYTVLSVETPTSLTLDRVYGDETEAGVAYTIQLTYLTAPSDFLSFQSVIDLDNNWKIWFGQFTQENLDRWDAQRTSTGSPWILAAAPFSTTGAVRYELWPRPTGPKVIPFTYIRKPPLMSANSDTPIFPIRGSVLLWGALAELSLWPGLTREPNAISSSDRYRAYEDRFIKGLAGLEVEDQQINQTRIIYDDFIGLPFAPIDAQYLQTHGLGF